MTTSGQFADTHGPASHERNLTNSQFVVTSADTQTLVERKLAMNRFHQPTPEEETLTIIGKWQSNMFTGGSKAETL